MTDELNRHDLCCALEDLALIQALGNQEDLIDQARIMLSADKVEIERLERERVELIEWVYSGKAEGENRRLRAALEGLHFHHKLFERDCRHCNEALSRLPAEETPAGSFLTSVEWDFCDRHEEQFPMSDQCPKCTADKTSDGK